MFLLDVSIYSQFYLSYLHIIHYFPRIYATTQGSSFLHGLSTYTVEEVSGSMRSLNVEIKLKFNLLQGFGNFKLGGHLFGGIVPLSGSGSIMYVNIYFT